MNPLRDELSKLITLPAIWVATAAGLLVPTVVAVITSLSAKDAISRGLQAGASADLGFQELAFGVVGAVIIGVVSVSSEYIVEGEDSPGRQITVSLTTVPSRLRFLLAKTTAVVITTMFLAAVAGTITLALVRLVLADGAPPLEMSRFVGMIAYWVLTALLAYGITLITRNGVVPLALLILNTSVVTVTYLLTRITPLAGYLPDMAGIHMFLREVNTGIDLHPIMGAVVMTCWVVALLAVGAFTAHRRDA